MIRFPLFQHLSVDRYGLYPGTAETPGMRATFNPGLTLVLGANGLGKSSLVLLLYRLCTGPSDISRVEDGTELGASQLKVTRLSAHDRKTFANRVNDGAIGATATLTFNLADTTVEITRELGGMKLIGCTIDSQPISPSEESFQREITASAGLDSFTDWILVLRYLVFYFEDRRSLVWDPTAQRQLLRLLFLPPSDSVKYRELEVEHLKADSAARNLSAVLTRQEKFLNDQQQVVASRSELQSRIARLSEEQDAEQIKLDTINQDINDLDADRQNAKLTALRAAEGREEAYRAVEYQRLQQILQCFPVHEESSAYILSHLLAGNRCLACGTDVPQLAQELRDRIDHSRCVVCSSSVDKPIEVANDVQDVATLTDALKKAEEHLATSSATSQEAELAFRSALRQVQELQTSLSSREIEIDRLVQQLPDSDKEIRERRSQLNALHSQKLVLEGQADEKREEYASFIERVNTQIATRRDEVKSAFDRHAQEFLLETCSLAWTSHKAQVGQRGDPIEFFVFEIDMTGTDFGSLVRRTGSDQVSESQREFIDLAFRMALIKIAGQDGVGSLIMDAPESSLDAVFASRAASVLSEFSRPELNNRVILTSNLVEGQLIPSLLETAGVTSRSDARIVDLFTIASPTAALSQLRSEYDDVLSKLFSGTPR